MKKWIKRLLKFVVAPVFVLALLAILVLLGWRASLQGNTTDARRIDTPNGINVLEAIDIGSTQQWIQIRGWDKSNPVLLYLHGGPGSPMIPLGHLFQTPWEEHFTVVQWDQRESGKSYVGDATAATMTTEQYIEDTLEVVKHLRERLGQDKIVLLGHSWGSLLGVNAIQRKPEWFHAYIGVGQVVNMQENERVTYEYTLQQAEERNNQVALAELEAIAPYPSQEDMMEKIGVQRKWLLTFGGSMYGETDFSALLRAALESPDYGLVDIYRFFKGMFFVLDFLMEELLTMDISDLGTEYRVPMFMFSGRYDYQVPSSINEAWFETITAPHKDYVWFEESCHMVPLAEPERFTQELVDRVLPFTKSTITDEVPVEVSDQ